MSLFARRSCARSFPSLSLLSRRTYLDRSFRVATVLDLKAAGNKREIKAENLTVYQQAPVNQARDTSRQLVIDVSHAQGYSRGHIPESVNISVDHFDYTRALETHGGLHQADVVEVMRQAGMKDETSEVILYDNSGMLACRFWYVLRYFGFRNVRVLNGGWREYLKSGLPVAEAATEVTVASSLTNLKPKRTNLLTKPGQMVFNQKQAARSVLIDTREPAAFNQYHIEQAINIPSSLFIENGKFKSVVELRNMAKNQGVSLDDPLIFYSQRSLSSCAGLFAFNFIGAEKVSLYDRGVVNWKQNFEERLSISAEEFLRH